MHSIRRSLLAMVTGVAIPAVTFAEDVQVQVTVENLAPMNSISFAPLRIGFNNGTYDSFNDGETATPAIISVAEGGSGSDWFPAFGAADPTAVLGTVVPDPAGPLLPGGMGMGVFDVDPTVNPYFTFAAMAVPSNDYFIGNDSPTAHELLDGVGNLNFSTIVLTAADLWDAGSEVDGPFGAAFLEGSMNSDHVDENGVVHHDFADLAVFNGLTTAAGYEFDSQLSADTDIYRISFAIVPEPATALLFGLGAVLAFRRRRAAVIPGDGRVRTTDRGRVSQRERAPSFNRGRRGRHLFRVQTGSAYLPASASASASSSSVQAASTTSAPS